MKTTYFATAEGHILGSWRNAGDSVGELTEREAKYLEMHGTIARTKLETKGKPPALEPDAAVIERKTR
ncbi:hypothetical protein PMI07_000880 [Rhizobium sp. CF080]|uniref:hypothetical protein n=1 Tax=Rhizobium sp. (strain CF080) TaxID=1144310 RepID=UPI000271892E|nr:hypothetical protein [Rhizobium sp. CF080]EUB97304.1 hypothetical protein PMI07_000880 [Rhizobium sp. CF080]